MQSAEDKARQLSVQQSGELPKHIAIIMDGNGRWAQANGKPRVFGHREGVESVRDIAEAAAQLGVEFLTLYTFSTENWNRPPQEVNALMQLLVRTLRKEVETLLRNKIRLKVIGDMGMLPDQARTELIEAMEKTERDFRMTLVLAISYSGRWDILNATRAIGRKVANGTLGVGDIDEGIFQQHLTTANLPEPDLLIRTGGDSRISNFLLWEVAYSELILTDVFWPAFRRENLYSAVQEFQGRERRFGRVSQTV